MNPCLGRKCRSSHHFLPDSLFAPLGFEVEAMPDQPDEPADQLAQSWLATGRRACSFVPHDFSVSMPPRPSPGRRFQSGRAGRIRRRHTSAKQCNISDEDKLLRPEHVFKKLTWRSIVSMSEAMDHATTWSITGFAAVVGLFIGKPDSIGQLVSRGGSLCGVLLFSQSPWW